MALAALGLAGCGARASTATAVMAPRRRVQLAPVRVAWDRIIRATVGLRPHRPSGFVLSGEKLDGKTVIHNYGHGGSGMSLSWGTGQMAAEIALEQPDRRAAVIGSGVAGLTTARQLQRRGFTVTIYAATVPPDTTSNMSLAGWTPTSGLVSFDRRTPAWEAQFRRAAEIAYHQLQLLAGPRYGISWIPNYALTNDIQASRGSNVLLPEALQGATYVYEEGEHPFPTRYAIERPELRIEPSIYLDALVADVIAHGGRTIIRKFGSMRDVLALDETVIVNCTGLGARELVGDAELMPLKGQLIVLVPQEEVAYSTNGGVANSPPGVFVHMMPRRDGIILGGTSQRDVWTTEIDEAERARVVDGHKALFDAIAPRR